MVRAERPATVASSVRLLGLGMDCTEVVAAGPQGSIDVDDLARVLSAGAGPTIVCRQAGSVNTGACDVVLNHVVVGFGDDDRTDRVVEAVQRDGTRWLGGTTWQGRRLMRTSASNYLTTESDVDLCVATIARLARDA